MNQQEAPTPKEVGNIARQLGLLDLFKPYHGVVHQACSTCGSIIWAQVAGGYRCLHCVPPTSLPERLRTVLNRALPRTEQSNQ